MTIVEKIGLNQKAVYWAFASYDKNGDPKVSSPAELDVHWEDGKTQTVAEDGETRLANATVILGQAVTVGSIMWQGAQADLPSPITPLYEVINYEAIPDIKGRYTQHTAILQRYAGTLPTVV